MANWQPSKVHSRYGAPMGRDSTRDRDLPKAPCRLSVQRVRLNQGGYDHGGAYWGTGEPLFRVADVNGDVELYLRASDREAAKAAVRAKMPAARFWR